MAIDTGNTRTYISEAMRDSIEIPTANPVFSTIQSSKKVSASNCNSDRQPEIRIRLPKPEIPISLELLQTASKFQQQIRHFRDDELDIKCSQVTATKMAAGNGKIGAQNVSSAVSGCRSLCNRSGQFFRARRGRKPQTCLLKFGRIRHGFRNINTSGFSGHSHFRLSVFVAISVIADNGINK